MATSQTPRPAGQDQESLGTLVHDLTQQISTLVRDEMRLAQAEMAEKGKKAGIGIGMFGGAGLVALYGLGALVATAILALALALPGWLAALIVAVVLFAIAGVLALMGKSSVSKATPAKPEEAMAGLREDVATVKGERGHGHV
jgi:uncharacterized membrane protein YqjE